jgi:glutathione synthase/RimK-type ligase-like ATP-grasp enzyme
MVSKKLKTPFFLKRRHSGQGRGVFLLSSRDELYQVLKEDCESFALAHSLEKEFFKEEVHNRFQNFSNSDFLSLGRWIFQESITESLGRDIRNFAITDKIYSIERKNEQSYLSNLHQGGKAFSTKISQEETAWINKIKEASGLQYAGIDLLRTKKGPLFIEINPSPGFQGIEAVHNVNLAGEIIKLLTF